MDHSHLSRLQRVEKRKLACYGCRSRKKKCDSVRPSCTPCRKWNVICEYGPVKSSSSIGDRDTSVLQPGTYGGKAFQDFWLASDLPKLADMNSLLLTPSPSAPTTTVSITPPAQEDESFVTVPKIADMPPQYQIVEMVEIFVTRYCKYLPCFHISSLRNQIATGRLQLECPLLVYAILAIAAPHHKELDVKKSHSGWAKNARLLYDLTDHGSTPAKRVLQAAACIIFFSITETDYSTAWLVLGKAWRQACSLGFNRIDSSKDYSTGLAEAALTECEKEERRRVMWCLFLLDRDNSYPAAGWSHAIDERQIVLKSPISENAFQLMDPRMPENTNTTPLVETYSHNPLQTLIEAYKLLGRVVQHAYVLEFPADHEEYWDEFARLEKRLVNFRGTLQRQSARLKDLLNLEEDGLSEVDTNAACQQAWAWMLYFSSVIILYHRPEEDWRVLHHVDLPAEKKLPESFYWNRCTEAAEEAIEMVQKLLGEALDLFISPHIAAALHIFCRITTLNWHNSHDDHTRAHISIMLHLYDRYAEVFPLLGKKFKAGVEYALHVDAKGVAKMRAGGTACIFKDCQTFFAIAKYKQHLYASGKLQMDSDFLERWVQNRDLVDGTIAT